MAVVVRLPTGQPANAFNLVKDDRTRFVRTSTAKDAFRSTKVLPQAGWKILGSDWARAGQRQRNRFLNYVNRMLINFKNTNPSRFRGAELSRVLRVVSSLGHG